MQVFLTPESWPFLGALILLVLICVVEGVGLLVGMSFSGYLDHLLVDGAHDVGNIPDSWLGWLHIGRVPMLVLLVVFLTAFAVIGFTINILVHATLGFYPHVALSAVAAFFGSLPVVRVLGAFVARVMPRDETSAVLLETLVGRVAVIVSGRARANYPAEARVRNEHGQTMYVRVEPDNEGVEFEAGTSVLLVKQISGTRFQAIANPRPDIL